VVNFNKIAYDADYQCHIPILIENNVCKNIHIWSFILVVIYSIWWIKLQFYLKNTY